jgi:hypothetical protein
MLQSTVSVGSVWGSDLLPSFDEIFFMPDIDGSSELSSSEKI